MLIKKSIYPKTKRIGNERKIIVTEKIDGSNLVLFVKEGVLYIAQRNTIYSVDEIESCKDVMYKGLYAWLKEHQELLRSEIFEGSAICCEWVGMGKLSYNGVFDNRIVMFAKARVDFESMTLINIKYNPELFKFAFNKQTIPSIISTIPVVEIFETTVSINDLNLLFAEYEVRTNRLIEGFVIYDTDTDSISKYVRRKENTLQDHKP